MITDTRSYATHPVTNTLVRLRITWLVLAVVFFLDVIKQAAHTLANGNAPHHHSPRKERA